MINYIGVQMQTFNSAHKWKFVDNSFRNLKVQSLVFDFILLLELFQTVLMIKYWHGRFLIRLFNFIHTIYNRI